jgi:two-component system response regulator AdeR
MCDDPTVLVVEDESGLVELYREWLADDYELRTATDGETALELVDDDVDVALIDRQLPGVSGDEVLNTIRDHGYDCRTAMVTAVDPDFDVIDMAFDDYLSKPVSEAELCETVESLLALVTYSELRLELSTKRVRHSVLRGEKRRAELDDSEAFGRLEDEIADLERQLADIEAEHPSYQPLFERVR